GHIVGRRWPPLGASTLAPLVARIPTRGVDGVVFLSDLLPTDFITAWAKRHPRFGHRLLVNADPNSAVPLTNGTVGLVGATPWPQTATATTRRFEAASESWFPGTGPDFYAY